jgi:hypothetical protein
MPKPVAAIVLGLIVFFGSAAVATADMCVDFNGIDFIAHNFTLPGRGACKPLLGTRLTFPFGGVACRTTDGDTLRLGLTWYSPFSIQHWHADIPLPDGTGGSGTQHVVSSLGVGTTGRSPVSIATCDPRNQPIP